MDSPEVPSQSPDDSSEDRVGPVVTVRSIRTSDVSALRPILETWIRYPDTHALISEEITDVLNRAYEAAAKKGTSKYFVAETNEGQIAGMIGLQSPDYAILPLATTPQPIEMTNFYVDAELRNSGVGTTLFNMAASQALQAGFSEMIWNSGPRYRETAWGYYTHKFGEPIGVLKDYYGPTYDAPVWHFVLSRQ